MDALSEVLRLVRLSGGVFLEGSFSAPWSVLSQIGPKEMGLIQAPQDKVVGFHYVLQGRMEVQVGDMKPVEVRAGEVVLLPHSDMHVIASDARIKAVDAKQLIQFQGDGAPVRVVHGGGGEATQLVCGFIGSDSRQHPLFEALPHVLALDLNGRQGADLITSSFQFAAREMMALRPGSATVLAKLSELLFVEAVREYVAGLPPEGTGWLAGLRDPAVGRALALMHARPAQPWTAETLAAQVLLSRSAFAERFAHLVGVPPMSYLTGWRMQLAAQALRESRRSMAQIAAEVGYESEATFCRAFKREMGLTPGRYRLGV